MTATHLVLLFQRNNLWEQDCLPLHAVHALDNDDDLLPRAIYPGLPCNDAGPQQSLQVLHIIVLKHLHSSCC